MRRVLFFFVILLLLGLSSSPGWSQEEALKVLSPENQERLLEIMKDRNAVMRQGQDAARTRNEQFINSERLESLSLSAAVLAGLIIGGAMVRSAIRSGLGQIAKAIENCGQRTT